MGPFVMDDDDDDDEFRPCRPGGAKSTLLPLTRELNETIGFGVTVAAVVAAEKMFGLGVRE